jgi:hypothetical protein
LPWQPSRALGDLGSPRAIVSKAVSRKMLPNARLTKEIETMNRAGETVSEKKHVGAVSTDVPGMIERVYGLK